MHYYKRNLGDYAKKAGRLSMLQHGAYTLLIDSCYDREAFPTKAEAIDWTWASSKEEIEAVEFVLSKFFTKQEDGTYTQKRIQEDLHKYHATAEINKRIANEREANRKLKPTNGERSVNGSLDEQNEPPPNHKPRTINQEPKKERENKQRFSPPSLGEVTAYVLERGSKINPSTFMDFYQSKNWMVGKSKMKDWKASFRTWEQRESQHSQQNQTISSYSETVSGAL